MKDKLEKLTITEVSKRLNHPRQTIHKWCKSGVFPNAKLTDKEFMLKGVWEIPVTDLINYHLRLKKPGPVPKRK
jgi:hypothetical protein